MEETPQDSEALLLLQKKIQEVFDQRDYYKDTVWELSERMDANIIEAYKWKAGAKMLFDVLSEYHDHHGLPKNTILHRKTLDALANYEKLLVDTKK